MLREQETLVASRFSVPESLKPDNTRPLPTLDIDSLGRLAESGWSRVGLMVAFTDSDGNIMLMNHNRRDKNSQGALGPLGETSKYAGPIIEQPLETLYRGVQEELAVEQPADLGLWMYQAGGWVINQWPRGTSYPGQYACAISFPVFVPDAVKAHLLDIPRGTEEIGGVDFFAPGDILGMDDAKLRPGVKQWLTQLETSGLLDPEHFNGLQPVDFSPIYSSALRDIDLQP